MEVLTVDEDGGPVDPDDEMPSHSLERCMDMQAFDGSTDAAY